jgi:hypothetical protein
MKSRADFEQIRNFTIGDLIFFEDRDSILAQFVVGRESRANGYFLFVVIDDNGQIFTRLVGEWTRLWFPLAAVRRGGDTQRY